MKKKKHPFLKIWMKVAVPVTLVSIVAIFLVLGLVLTALRVIEIARVELIAQEDALIIQRNSDLSRWGDLEAAFHLDAFHMVAVLCDSNGREIVRSDISQYQSKRLSQEQLSYMMGQMDAMVTAWNQDSGGSTTPEYSLFGYSYAYGCQELYTDAGNYLFVYGGVSAPWIWYGRQLCLMGFFLMVLVLALSTLIAISLYRMYCKEIRLEEYHVRTSNAIAHDLKTPMMAVSGYAENLLENVHTEKREYYARAILNNLERMNGILETMLHLTDTGGMKGNLNKQEVNLLELTEEVLAQYKDLLESKEISASVNGKAVITADPVLMRRVIDNLVNNAVKYTPVQESISIRMSAQEYEIGNTGISIERRRRMDMWKPFERADKARSAGTMPPDVVSDPLPSARGTGVGLTIVRDILNAHGFRYRLTGDKDRVVVRIQFWS